MIQKAKNISTMRILAKMQHICDEASLMQIKNLNWSAPAAQVAGALLDPAPPENSGPLRVHFMVSGRHGTLGCLPLFSGIKYISRGMVVSILHIYNNA